MLKERFQKRFNELQRQSDSLPFLHGDGVDEKENRPHPHQRGHDRRAFTHHFESVGQEVRLVLVIGVDGNPGIVVSPAHGVPVSGDEAPVVTTIFGAPNLTDDTWLYGGSDEKIRETIVKGRNGLMPAHGDLFGENRTKILAAYIYSLSQE